MNFLKTANIIFCLLISLLFSCKKNVNIHIPEQPAKLVVNCLFNPDSSWKVFVGTDMAPDDTAKASIVENANVTLYGGNGPIQLTYLGRGYYVSDLKPKAGVPYTIRATAPGYPSVEASGSIPAKLNITSFTFDTVPITITDLLILDEVKVNKLVLSIDAIKPDSYAQVKVQSYLKSNLFYYTITDSTLMKAERELKEQFGDYPGFEIPSIISKLSALKDIPVLSWIRLVYKMHDVLEPVRWEGIVESVISKYAERRPAKKHLEDLFRPISIAAPQQPFYNIYDESDYSAFAEGGKYSGNNQFLFYSDASIYERQDSIIEKTNAYRELWVELTSLSEDAYLFKTTFIKQQLNQDNLFRDPVRVYSNIKGGLGIFAGYQLQQVRIY